MEAICMVCLRIWGSLMTDASSGLRSISCSSTEPEGWGQCVHLKPQGWTCGQGGTLHKQEGDAGSGLTTHTSNTAPLRVSQPVALNSPSFWEHASRTHTCCMVGLLCSMVRSSSGLFSMDCLWKQNSRETDSTVVRRCMISTAMQDTGAWVCVLEGHSETKLQGCTAYVTIHSRLDGRAPCEDEKSPLLFCHFAPHCMHLCASYNTHISHLLRPDSHDGVVGHACECCLQPHLHKQLHKLY